MNPISSLLSLLSTWRLFASAFQYEPNFIFFWQLHSPTLHPIKPGRCIFHLMDIYRCLISKLCYLFWSVIRLGCFLESYPRFRFIQKTYIYVRESRNLLHLTTKSQLHSWIEIHRPKNTYISNSSWSGFPQLRIWWCWATWRNIQMLRLIESLLSSIEILILTSMPWSMTQNGPYTSKNILMQTLFCCTANVIP